MRAAFSIVLLYYINRGCMTELELEPVGYFGSEADLAPGEV